REVRPEIEKRVLRDERFSPSELARFPRREGIDVRPRTVRRIGVEVLETPVDVEADPRIRDAVATEVLLSEDLQIALEALELFLREEVPSRSAKHAVLVLDMPVVPDETSRARIPRV